MPTPLQHLRRRMSFDDWANRIVEAMLRGTPNIEPRAGILFAHIVAARTLWLRRIRGQDTAGITPWPQWTLDQAATQAQTNHTDFEQWCQSAPADALDHAVTYQNSQGERFTSTVGDIFDQLFTHGAYHRDQLAVLVARAGGKPQSTDFITFCRNGY